MAYTWQGGHLQLDKKRRANGTCTVTPASGERRTVDEWQRAGRYSGLVELDPWFSGSARVQCTMDVTVRTGFWATLKRLVSGPLIYVIVVISRRRRTPPR
ncbi:hypothetical protein EV193_101402 [Herbihabitans rhizosphaerae]|uniref:Uncharacterized protein n=1 Tax=Herbihabitans rhizosphaerae TaxID=1872711 RepID=A0A4Q7L5K2_9PSEU|nr:hypothetical protein [Herbihabitans rhizosphaerae]RZS44526.1 hypothetical protein EV193_101402 [Herbihabitans rhizosphaerae]